MIKTKNKSARKFNFNKSNPSNQNNSKNIILISHSKNKSVDLKNPKKYNLLLLSNKDILKNTPFKNKKNIYLKGEKDSINSHTLLKNRKNKSKSNILSNIKTSPNKINIKKSKLKKFGSFPNMIDKCKKKFFFDENFFNKNLKKNKKNNIFYKQNSFRKQQDNSNIKKIFEDTKNLKINSSNNNNKYTKRIIKRKSNNIQKDSNIKISQEEIKKLKNENDDSRNCDVSNNDNSISDKIFDIKQPLIKSNIIYIKNKINKNVYSNRKCSSSRITWNQKGNYYKINKKDESIIKSKNNILNDSLESHNTIYDEDFNINYNLIKNNCKDKNLFKIKNNDKLYKKIITRKRNIVTDSLNISNSQKNLSKSFSKKNYTINNIPYRCDKNCSNTSNNIKSQIIYRKVNSKRMSMIHNSNINYYSSSSLLTTQNQTNKCKDNTNIIINKDVTEFLYSEDLIEGNYKYKDTNLKKWLSDINLSIYSQNFYDNNVFNVNELINDMKKLNDKKTMYEYIENTFNIHIPGHIYRILCKLEIDSGLLDNKLGNFFIPKNDNNINKINNMKPSLLLKKYNSCENFFNCYGNSNSFINKNNLKNFLKKYHLINFYYNFYQNGFDLINIVLLQMFSNYYSINDNILENSFHIYNKNDRILVLNSLLKEKENIDLFINSDKFKQSDNNNININYYNYYNNYDNYFISKESEENNCNICYIY